MTTPAIMDAIIAASTETHDATSDKGNTLAPSLLRRAGACDIKGKVDGAISAAEHINGEPTVTLPEITGEYLFDNEEELYRFTRSLTAAIDAAIDALQDGDIPDLEPFRAMRS